jgi:preprotein translocase subunit SecE
LQVQVLHALPAGEVAEWSIAAVLKTASGESLTGVRIPPSPPEKDCIVSNTEILILAVVIGGVFGLLWWQGQLQRIAVYVQETREELRKCSWPTWDELKGSTLLIAIAIVLMGVFTYVIDRILIFIFIQH